MWLGVVPVVLGKGKPLFSDINQRTYFRLARPFLKMDTFLSIIS